MRYLALWNPDRNQGPTPEGMAAMDALIQREAKAGVLLTTGGLKPGRTRMVSKDGKVSVTDGPFAESKEVIGGFAIIEAPSHEEALAAARRFIAVAGNGTCELHAMFGPEDFQQPHQIPEVAANEAKLRKELTRG